MRIERCPTCGSQRRTADDIENVLDMYERLRKTGGSSVEEIHSIMQLLVFLDDGRDIIPA